ncbi:MAG: hypothetical protein K9N55_03835 [Phycisphaerae bacterium]|nr:hypothetical protein [Phycisphaerae bacterium]
MVIEDIQLKEAFLNRTLLTPSERGAVSSLVGFGNAEQTRGTILASDVPSALRLITDHGAMGYNSEYFEWILGPSECFVSEPVFINALPFVEGAGFRETVSLTLRCKLDVKAGKTNPF